MKQNSASFARDTLRRSLRVQLFLQFARRKTGRFCTPESKFVRPAQNATRDMTRSYTPRAAGGRLQNPLALEVLEVLPTPLQKSRAIPGRRN
jgi:hypothetical protein